MTVNPFFLHPQPATKTTATNSKKIMMKHLLKVLLLVNFEFQGILTDSLGGGGVRGLGGYLWGLGIPSRRSQDMLQPRSQDLSSSRAPEGMGERREALGTRLDK